MKLFCASCLYRKTLANWIWSKTCLQMEYTRLLALLQKPQNPKIAFTYAQKLQICFEYCSKAPKLLKIFQILNNLKNYFTNLKIPSWFINKLTWNDTNLNQGEILKKDPKSSWQKVVPRTGGWRSQSKIRWRRYVSKLK